tara:strand:+ start:591 stop:725 length:135 start_codon:yes stop_codon:yes gene_type:complete
MTKRSMKKTDKKGRETVWEWEETPELKAFIEKQTGVKTPPTRPT